MTAGSCVCHAGLRGVGGQSMSESQPEPAQPCAEALGGQRD